MLLFNAYEIDPNMRKLFCLELLKTPSIIFVITGLVCFIGASADDWEYKLVHHILDGYDNAIRPSSHHNVTLNVTFGVALTQIIDVVSDFYRTNIY